MSYPTSSDTVSYRFVLDNSRGTLRSLINVFRENNLTFTDYMRYSHTEENSQDECIEMIINQNPGFQAGDALELMGMIEARIENVKQEFEKITGLKLDISTEHDDRDGEDNWDIHFAVSGAHIWSRAGEKYKEHIHHEAWLSEDY